MEERDEISLIRGYVSQRRAATDVSPASPATADEEAAEGEVVNIHIAPVRKQRRVMLVHSSSIPITAVLLSAGGMPLGGWNKRCDRK